MTLASLLTPERVLPAMRATEHWPAIVEAIDRLIDVGGYPAEDREALLDSFRRREDRTAGQRRCARGHIRTGIGNTA